MKARPIINSFVSGELSPRLAGRTDIAQYYQSASEILNCVIEYYGGVKKTPGTKYVATVKTSSKATRIIPFIFSDTQAYIIEVGDLYMRFYRDNGQIISGTPVEVVTPYTAAQIFDLQFAQKEDVLYITHPSHAQAQLTRTSHTAWALTTIDYSVDPNRPALMDQNITTTTITPSAATGTGITLTASASLFNASHVGSIWKIHEAYVKVTAFTSATVVTASVLYSGNIGGTSAYLDWSEGCWSDYRGYPKCVTISESRLCYGYTAYQPQTSWQSVTGEYHNFERGSADADAMAFKADTNAVEVINWLFPADEILLGTVSGLHSLGTGSDQVALTPTTARIKKRSTYGASSIIPKQIGNNVYYWQKYNKVLREYAISVDTLQYESGDATAVSDHIAGDGIVDMAYQQSPDNVLWCVRSDGKLSAFTRQIEHKVSAWSGHDTQGLYKSVAVIPKTSYDEVWFIVERVVNGSTVKYIEYMTAPTFSEQEDMIFTHSSLTLDNPKNITGATSADPCVITCVSHGYSNLDTVVIRGVGGMTELNKKKFKVANVASGTFELTDLDGNDIDATGYAAYISGGEVRKCVNSVSGLSHLEGKTVQVLVDGAEHPDRVVASGAISLTGYYGQIAVGLGYTARVKSNDLEPIAGQAVGQGRSKRITKASVSIYNSLGGTVGNGTIQDEIIYRKGNSSSDRYIDLFTGIKQVDFPAGWDKEKYVVIEQTKCLPLHIRNIALDIEAN